MSDPITARLEETFGLDLGFDATLGAQDVVEAISGADYNYQQGPIALKEEIERLFITPKGSCVDDPTYGIDLSMIGETIFPPVTCGMVRVAVLDALEHPSFRGRFQVEELEVGWSPDSPGAVVVYGVLGVFGFAGVFWQFGPVALQLAQSR